MHFASGSAYPSYRLITALRLYSIFPSGPLPASALAEEMVRPWKETVTGQRLELSGELEAAWRDVLQQVCHAVVDRAVRALANPAVKSQDSIATLWEEERYIAQCVLDRIHNGEDFA